MDKVRGTVTTKRDGKLSVTPAVGRCLALAEEHETACMVLACLDIEASERWLEDGEEGEQIVLPRWACRRHPSANFDFTRPNPCSRTPLSYHIPRLRASITPHRVLAALCTLLHYLLMPRKAERPTR